MIYIYIYIPWYINNFVSMRVKRKILSVGRK